MTQKREVWCSGSQFLVTASLYEALSYLRYPDRTRTLWIDAVCINQDDIEERAAQVAIMRLIYTQADRVIIWLGVDDDLTPTAIGRLCDSATSLAKELLHHNQFYRCSKLPRANVSQG